MTDQPLFLLMVKVGEEAHGSFWAAVNVEGYGRKLTRHVAEAAVPNVSETPRFLMPLTRDSEPFGRGDAAPTFAMPAGQSVWDYGEPTWWDTVGVLKDCADGAEMPDAEHVSLPVAAVLGCAAEIFGAPNADSHTVETHFDAAVMHLGGSRDGDPPAYRLLLGRLFGLPV